MASIIPILFAASLVGIIHMSAPDHWLTLAIIGKRMGWSHDKLVGMSMVSGLGHVALSVALGLAIAVLGLFISKTSLGYLTGAMGVALVLLGILYAAKSLMKDEKPDYDGEVNRKKHEKLTYLAVLGAALSPDLAVLPVLLAAVPLGISAVAYTSLVYAIASILTLSILVSLCHRGFAKAFEKIQPKYNDALVGLIIAAVGAYVLAFG